MFMIKDSVTVWNKIQEYYRTVDEDIKYWLLQIKIVGLIKKNILNMTGEGIPSFKKTWCAHD